MNWDKLDFYLECSNKSLGLRDQDGLPEYYFQATSYREGLLNKRLRKKWGSINKSPSTTWCPLKKNVKNSFLEVDLLQQFLLCGVSTQGDESHGFTKTFKIQLSSDRIHWHFYQNGTNKVRLSIWSNHCRHSYIYRGEKSILIYSAMPDWFLNHPGLRRIHKWAPWLTFDWHLCVKLFVCLPL